MRSHCDACGGTGWIWSWSEPWPDVCLDCEDEWCRLRACSGRDRHLVDKCNTVRKAA